MLSPSTRARAVDRIRLLGRWWGDRGDLTAGEAASLAGVSTKRFYQMASAWRRQPGLLAVGAHAAAPADRTSRIHPLVNAALLANVGRVVAENDDRSVEWLRRLLEERARADLPERDEHGNELSIPSPNVVRSVITRELNRIAETKMLGESIAMDMCPTSMRSPSGQPFTLFVIIDRGTLRIVGSSIGFLDQAADGYSRAARRALIWLFDARMEPLPWAGRTRRVDMVVGQDNAPFGDFAQRYARESGVIEVQAITGERRLGSQLRKYVGDRVGRVLLRPSWAQSAPEMTAADEVFTFDLAAERADLEVQLYNQTKVLERPTVEGSAAPEEFIELIKILAGGPPVDAPSR